MSEPQRPMSNEGERVDYKVQIVRIVLAPLTKIFQNEVCFILMLILGLAGWGVYWAACRLETFATEKIPQHIEAINKGSADIARQFGDDLKSQREHYIELRKIDEKNIDRIERLATGKKTVGTGSKEGDHAVGSSP